MRLRQKPEKKIIHIWNIYEEEALESRLFFSTSILLHSLQTIPCEQCIFCGGKFSQPGEGGKKKAPAKGTKGIF